MDPNETLRMIRYYLRLDNRRGVYAEEIAEHFEALDEWLLGAGFFPDEWRHGRPVEGP